jgi:uncharacterized protein YukE
MSKPDVRMNYSSMERMAKEFANAARQIQDSSTQMDKLAKMMEDGALVGMGGDQFRDAIRSKLMKKMKTLNAKMSELQKDIQGAVQATRDGVSTAQSRFK